MNAAALVGALAITGIAMLIFGIAPAINTSRVNLEQVLRSDVRHGASRASRLATEGLVAGQMALAVLVLSAAGVITRSLLKLERADLSFEPSQLTIAELSIPDDRFDSREKQIALLDRLIEGVRAIPGVRHASPVVAVPFAGSGGWDGRPSPVGQPPSEAADNPMLNMDVVSPDYFATFGIPLLRGRAFTPADREGAPEVVVLSESAARHYWPAEDAIGKRLTMGPESSDTATVIGIVPDTRYRDLRDARASIYLPLHQSIFPFAPTTLAIRTSVPLVELVPALRRVIAEPDPAAALAGAA
ncbi:MAG: ABC transporter permease, partial [Gemmatimonadetes bacterium]|nr:ABC transporter permease [Gemmatimonadota bacterium]